MLQPGDILFLSGKGLFGQLVNWFQALWSKDAESKYNHTGIIINSNGDILETTYWRTKVRNIMDEYPGSMIAITRWEGMDEQKFTQGFDRTTEQMLGHIYPYWRYPLFMLNLSQFIKPSNGVCSELVTYFLTSVGAFHDRWWGVDVDELWDWINQSLEWTVVYKGTGRGALE